VYIHKFIAGIQKRDIIEWSLFVFIFGVLPLLMRSEYWVYLSTEIMIWGFFAIAFNLLFGLTGLLSFGQAAFFGIGAYSYALLIMNAKLPFAIALPIAIIIPAFAAFVLGPLCIRLKEVFFALMTLAFSQLIWAVTFKWYGFTGGDNGIQGIPAPKVLNNPLTTYYVIFIVVFVCIVLCWLIRNSPFGSILKSIRENRDRAPFLGINIKRYQLAVFIISGFFCGVAGVLFALFQRSIHPQLMYWHTSGDVVLMTILGGFSTFFGSMLGAIIIVFIRDFISAYTEYWLIFVGSIILICVILFPKGILGSIHSFFGSNHSIKGD